MVQALKEVKKKIKLKHNNSLNLQRFQLKVRSQVRVYKKNENQIFLLKNHKFLKHNSSKFKVMINKYSRNKYLALKLQRLIKQKNLKRVAKVDSVVFLLV